MAETKDDIDVAEKGGNSKILIIIIAVLVLALGGVGAMLLMGGDDAPAEQETAEASAPKVKAAPIYHAVEKPLIVNFAKQSGGAVRYLQVKLKVMARDQAVIDAFSLNLPAIQHELLLLLYAQDYDELNTTGTKELQNEVLSTINSLLESETGDKQLEAVYFTSFLMQ